ncbi:MAG TPA: hypothetical protein VNL71_20380, partial [Chloroflexota bacterium]|nr:hypothetical protein [Chloroflexota bacterium]
LVRDWPRACYHGWEFARTSALTIALQERQPYTSSHARRREAAERGHGMADLLAALTTGAHNQLRVALEAVWAATLTWGTPSIQE